MERRYKQLFQVWKTFFQTGKAFSFQAGNSKSYPASKMSFISFLASQKLLWQREEETSRSRYKPLFQAWKAFSFPDWKGIFLFQNGKAYSFQAGNSKTFPASKRSFLSFLASQKLREEDSNKQLKKAATFSRHNYITKIPLHIFFLVKSSWRLPLEELTNPQKMKLTRVIYQRVLKTKPLEHKFVSRFEFSIKCKSCIITCSSHVTHIITVKDRYSL